MRVTGIQRLIKDHELAEGKRLDPHKDFFKKGKSPSMVVGEIQELDCRCLGPAGDCMLAARLWFAITLYRED